MLAYPWGCCCHLRWSWSLCQRDQPAVLDTSTGPKTSNSGGFIERGGVVEIGGLLLGVGVGDDERCKDPKTSDSGDGIEIRWVDVERGWYGLMRRDAIKNES